jgi:hypothetical protein
MTWDTEYDEAITYSSRTTITTEEHDIKMPCGIRTGYTLNHPSQKIVNAYGHRDENKRIMRRKADKNGSQINENTT